MVVSVIIPVYNVERYIGECINSVIAQDYKELEIVLVDDGSTDSSGDICEEYAEKDSRIKVYHIDNSGLSGARNYGTAKATGEFVCYLDGDDCFAEGAISSWVEKIKGQVDIVVSKFAMFSDGSTELDSESFVLKDEYVNGKSGEDAFACLIDNIDRPLWSACRILVRRKLLTENNLSFRLGILSEDLDVVPHFYRFAREIAVNNRVTLLYRINRKGSIMTTVSPKRYIDIYDIITRWLEFLKTDTSISKNFRNAMTRQMHKLFFSYLKKYKYLSNKDLIPVVKAASPLSYLLDCDFVYSKYRTIYKLFGFKILVLIMRIATR